MCTIVVYGGDELRTQASVVALLGGDPAVLRFVGGYDPPARYDPELCLCSIDVGPTFAEAGWTASRDETWGEWTVEAPLHWPDPRRMSPRGLTLEVVRPPDGDGVGS